MSAEEDTDGSQLKRELICVTGPTGVQGAARALLGFNFLYSSPSLLKP